MYIQHVYIQLRQCNTKFALGYGPSEDEESGDTSDGTVRPPLMRGRQQSSRPFLDCEEKGRKYLKVFRLASDLSVMQPHTSMRTASNIRLPATPAPQKNPKMVWQNFNRLVSSSPRVQELSS